MNSVVPGNALFTLPSGYRPSATCLFTIDSNGVFGTVTVASSGVVTFASGNAGSGFVSLDGISFDTL